MDSQFIDFKIISKTEKADLLARCVGHNEKGIFVLYPQSDQEQLPFLKKILQAVQLDYEQDTLALVGEAQLTFSITDLLPAAALTKVLIFGFPTAQIGLHLQLAKYQPYTIGSCTYLFADTLASIEQQANLKRSLWEGLQTLFNDQ